MVDGVVVHAVSHVDDGFGQRGRPRPAEPHSLVAGHVDEECARRESREIVFRHEDQRRAGILQHAVDDDVVVREEACHRDRTRRRIRPCSVWGVLVMSQLDYLCRVDRRTDGGHLPVGQHTHIVDAVGVQCDDRAMSGGGF